MVDLDMTMRFAIFVILLLCHANSGSNNKAVKYQRLGDINLALLTNIHEPNSDNQCGSTFVTHYAISSEGASYALDIINNDDRLLPNVSLGFIMVDGCQRDLVALSWAIHFVDDTCDDASNARRVVGVIGPDYSRQAVMVSSFLGLFDIPVLSTFATSDELSDKSRFKYFLRMVLPDRFKSVALADILDHFGWSYISLVYSEGSYGENGARKLTQEVQKRGNCIAVSRRVPSNPSTKDINGIVDELGRNLNAKVVILYVEDSSRKKLMRGLEREGLDEHFLFLAAGKSSLPDLLEVPERNIASGSVYLSYSAAVPVGYKEFLLNRNITNPWFLQLWEKFYNCEWKRNTTVQQDGNFCDDLDIPIDDIMTNIEWRGVSKIVDGFLIYAHALHGLISDRCPTLFQHMDFNVISACIDGELLLQYLMNVSFDSHSGHISFDANGDLLGHYDVKQYRWNRHTGHSIETIGKWNISTKPLHMYNDVINEYPLTNLLSVESLCSKPCANGQYYRMKELSCCWDCEECRSNEIIKNATSCEICPPFAWPEATKSRCEPIPPITLRYQSAEGIGILCLGIAGVSLSLLLVGVYAVKRSNQLLKATSRELSVTVLFGCMTSCCLGMLFVGTPAPVMCAVRQNGFHFAICLIYSPLLMKTQRIYRIFSAGKKGVTRPRYISNGAQLFGTSMILICLVLLLITIETQMPSTPHLLMPFPFERYVEISCTVSMARFVPPLCFNMVVIVACGVLGFLTRRLPENFNDSRYIFVSISTTFFMWMVFVPTYFTTFHSHHKSLLLSFCLLLNAYITMLLQFSPKVYAIFYVSEQAINIKTVTSTAVTSVHQQ